MVQRLGHVAVECEVRNLRHNISIQARGSKGDRSVRYYVQQQHLIVSRAAATVTRLWAYLYVTRTRHLASTSTYMHVSTRSPQWRPASRVAEFDRWVKLHKLSDGPAGPGSAHVRLAKIHGRAALARV